MTSQNTDVNGGITMIQIRRAIMFVAILFYSLSLSAAADAYAENEKEYTLTTMYDGSTVNCGKDTGYSENNRIKNGDLHFGWSLCMNGKMRNVVFSRDFSSATKPRSSSRLHKKV